MSNALSIAAVTAVIKYLLENGLVSDAIASSIGDVLVTALPPDKIQVGTDERAQLNLFLYQFTQNRNVDWISQESRNRFSRINPHPSSTNPPLALNLHYLLTAYGPKDFQAEILLGYAMQLLHKSPIITSAIIENALKNSLGTSTANVFSQALAGVPISDLAEQIGQIKISPELFKLEETSKIWSALQTNYRPSATYEVSMVLIDGNEFYPSKSSYLIPLFQPHIKEVIAPAELEQKIIVGSTLIIRGQGLRGDFTKIRLGNTEKLFAPFDVQEIQVSLLVPPDLLSGVQSVQVVHLMIESTGQIQNLQESNVVPFVLHPKITASVAQLQKDEDNLCSAAISVQCNPKVGKEQRVILLLNEISKDNPATYSFAVENRNEDTNNIMIPIKKVKPGSYLVRVRVDGAESLLYRNQTGEYDSPQVLIQ
ncbi:DUF4255 domain-containing protein [Anabaena subtropica]|uniref:DUF4255 domain-containing protein n=1 Tax=Anabaena subtropica FACHB-260 TaxID=2692884 RepID=A0ABR8CLY1_9NOST|nr:DUF4255 domain-containing protein [Anabaena subtropica]MBD2343781.1 DUF4255 domain-containing protein [Anabaena subtropica FACHB-260]